MPRSMRIRALPLLLLLAAAVAQPPALAQPTPAPSPVVFKKGSVVLLASGRRTVLRVEVADTPEARGRGLMHRTSLADDAGMLFIFEQQQRWGFWMKNTLIPLSIAFIDRNWRIVDVQDMAVAPDPREGPFTIYESRAPARYALEVRQGLFKERGVGLGARVIYTPAR